ncbi:MAG: right-handed parallel beta-helix repeat-containing protein, partial [Gemmatimonadetes bacterium]|nr:right-handed parallel beta-helix repeat-containing protein [Gemmatimonadota bacterium]
PLENDWLPALEIHGARSRFINLVVHDAGQQGITFWDDAVDAEVYGCVVYNNGTHENLDHGIYVHNHTGTKLVESNVLFQNLAYGVHAFAESGNPVQRNVHLLENVAFNNGTISTRYGAKGNILVGGEVPAAGMRVVGNLLYFAVDTAGVNLTVGLDSVDNQEIIVQGNYLWGGATAMLVGPWQRATVEGNALAGTGDMVDLWATVRAGPWRANVYYRNPVDSAWQFRGVGYPLSAWQAATGLGTGDQATESPPAKAEVFVRPNRYEPGRAFIVVRNWPRALAVDIDLSGVLKGGVYEIRNVQDIFGPPVVQGVYGGAGSVTLPMTGVTPPAAIGRSTPAPERTAPDFDVFLLTTPER